MVFRLLQTITHLYWIHLGSKLSIITHNNGALLLQMKFAVSGKFANNNKFERFSGIEATPVDEFDKACEVHDKCYSLLEEPHSEKCKLPFEIYWRKYDWDYRYDKSNDVSTKCKYGNI